MALTNYDIADQFSLLSKLMDIHGENSFKTKSYSIAAFTIEKLPEQLSAMDEDKIFAIKGIGNTIGKKIMEMRNTGELPVLKDYIRKTPPGVIEMLNIKGLGPKKIATVWKEMEIESIGELMYACNENRLLLYKGFGEKSQNNIRETIDFYLKNQGSHLYGEIENYVLAIDKKLKESFAGKKIELTGEWRRQLEIIDRLEWITTASLKDVSSFFEKNGFVADARPSEKADRFILKGPENIQLSVDEVDEGSFYRRLFESSCSNEFLKGWQKEPGEENTKTYTSEEEIFSAKNIHFIPAFEREKATVIEKARQQALSAVIQPTDIKAIIHSHSNWSDGSNTIEEMAKASIEKGYEYLVLSDHSKSAFYANGLTEERIREQHHHIDELNQKLSPFKIFKSIECDILNDGNLDYSDNILSTFDLVITSIHSNLKMTEDKAMMRLLRAIENPYTTILGHMTGRLLLSRPGYPVNHKKIIEACATNRVVIELNAHPRRLDIDWRWIDYALEKNVLISIDPDAHSIEGYHDVRYGTLVAQKAGLTKDKNLSSFSLQQIESFLTQNKKA
ncbi:MAG TPA: PHP domain-containing protein [Puia sp.]|nr:PHP domain-containing protein [Puia sp.]